MGIAHQAKLLCDEGGHLKSICCMLQHLGKTVDSFFVESFTIIGPPEEMCKQSQVFFLKVSTNFGRVFFISIRPGFFMCQRIVREEIVVFLFQG